jgi:Domain of unknown function (DUF4398)
MAALLVIALVTGCAGAPVQEMSDARQAVKAAHKAGADQFAPDLMAEAQRLLASAKTNVSKGEYRMARDEAEQAREKAMEARRIAELASAPQPGP